MKAVLLALLVGALLAACSPPAVPSQPAPFPSSPPTGPTLDASQRAALNYARQDLAQRLEVAQDEIHLHSIEAVDWPDTGLGCPPTGTYVLAETVPGYRIILTRGEETYEYHSGGTILPRLCQARATAISVQRVAPGDVLTVEGEMVSLGNMPFSRLAISMPDGESLEVLSSALARQISEQPRRRRTYQVRVVGRGLITPIAVEILSVRSQRSLLPSSGVL